MIEMITDTYGLGDQIRADAARGRQDIAATREDAGRGHGEAAPGTGHGDGLPHPGGAADQCNSEPDAVGDLGQECTDDNLSCDTDFPTMPSPVRDDPEPEPGAAESTEEAVLEEETRFDVNNEYEGEQEHTGQSYDGSSSNDEELDWGDSDDDKTESYIRALEEAAATPLFEGSELSSMGTTYLLLNSGKLHGCTDIYMDELFRTLCKSVLPKPNSLPSSYREASAYVKRLGHSYKSYDICPNNCRLFRGTLANAESCPKCRAPRRKRAGKSMVPHKVLRHFPLIPRLKRMFRSPVQASAMVWWALQQNDDGVMRHVSHSKQWKWINERYAAEFAYDDRCIRLALIADGFNPSADKRSTYSIWPVLLLNYNIAPWFTTKKYFIMLSLLMPGPKSVTAEHFDEWMSPLVDELLELWTYGIYCKDAARYKESSSFILRAMVIWTIGDFPAYGL